MNLILRSVTVLLLGVLASASAQNPTPPLPSSREPDRVIHIWQEGGWKGALPDHWKLDAAEVSETSGDVTRTKNISDPTLSYFAPDKDKAEAGRGKGIIICPGGGYSILAWDLEGTEIATWLSSIGYHAWILKYRLPRPGMEDVRHHAALQDAQRSLSLVRHQARQTGNDPDQTGILGFSAGGHLAALASVDYGNRAYTVTDEIDAVSCRPSFTVLIYPAYLVKDADSPLLPAFPVTGSTPPAFLSHAGDDPVTCRSSIEYYLALKKNKVSAELHIWPDGGHGYGMRSPVAPKAWPSLLSSWLAR